MVLGIWYGALVGSFTMETRKKELHPAAQEPRAVLGF